jgi:Ca2+-binding RTX toxin-like protein
MGFVGGAPGDDSLDGTDGRDVLSGHAGDDVLRGGPGNDTEFGGNGNDRLQGGDDADGLRGGRGDDLLFGGNGTDVLDAGGGRDVLYGGKGDDGVFGFAGSDTVFGGNGDDFVSGESGTDLVFGGNGFDAFGAYILEAGEFPGDSRFHPDAEYFMDFHRGEDFLLINFIDEITGQFVLEGFNAFDHNGDGKLTGADKGVSIRDVSVADETERSTVINLGAAIGGPFDHNDLIVVFGVTGLQPDDFAAS